MEMWWRRVRVYVARMTVCALSWGAVHAEAPRFVGNETFTYALYVQQGFISIKAGTASIAIVEASGGYEARLTLQTTALVEAIFHVDVRITTRLTRELKPLRYEKHVEEGSRVYDEECVFSYPPGGGCVVSSRRTHADGRVEVGKGRRERQVYDLLSLFFYARRLDFARLTPEKRVSVPVVSGVRVRDKTLVYKGEEEVEIADGGKVKAGVFVLYAWDGNESARFAFSQEGTRVPQRLDVALKFGSGSARLCPENSATPPERQPAPVQ